MGSRARYFFKVPAILVLGTLLKVPAVPALKNQKHRGTSEKKFHRENTALYFVDFCSFILIRPIAITTIN